MRAFTAYIFLMLIAGCDDDGGAGGRADGMPSSDDGVDAMAGDAMPDAMLDAMPAPDAMSGDAMSSVDAMSGDALPSMDALPDAGPADAGPADAGPPQCAPGVTVAFDGAGMPPAIIGHYTEAFDCARDEGGAWFGGADFTRCFRKVDGSPQRIWNTGCGWEIGELVDGSWERTARTYTGPCAEMPDMQRDERALTTGVLYDGFGSRLPGLRADHCSGPAPICDPGVEVTGEALPPALVGRYAEAFDCARDEGGAWFGGADYTRCFRKADGSSARVWNTGCGWELGQVVDGGWTRAARTYSGRCDAIPPSQLDASALSTGVLYDGFGALLDGARFERCPGLSPACDPQPPQTRVEVTWPVGDAPPGINGAYAQAFDCARGEGGAWFGGVDYTRCYRKTDRSSWRIWNTGCGWEIGQPVDGGRGQPAQWQRSARTYSGVCDAMPALQRDARALTTGVLYDGFGAVLPDVRIDHCPGPPPMCMPGVAVGDAGEALPAGAVGQYTEAFDCEMGEGGAWFGGSDFTHCFRRADGSAWRIWNTGCGWEIGRADPDWQRVARTYSGPCDAMPEAQLGVQALTTGVLYDGFGAQLPDVRVDHCPLR